MELDAINNPEITATDPNPKGGTGGGDFLILSESLNLRLNSVTDDIISLYAHGVGQQDSGYFVHKCNCGSNYCKWQRVQLCSALNGCLQVLSHEQGYN